MFRKSNVNMVICGELGVIINPGVGDGGGGGNAD